MHELTRRSLLHYSAALAGGLALPRSVFGGGPVDLSGGIDPQREFVLAEAPTTPGIRDAVNVWIEEQNGDFAMRLGVEALAEEWDKQLVWLDIAFADGRVYCLRDENGPTHPAIDKDGRPTIRGSAGARFQCVEPFQRWDASFNGPVPRTTAQVLADGVWEDDEPTESVSFDIQMHMAVPPWQPGTLSTAASAAFEGEQGEFISPRYEQLFRCAGNLVIDGKSREFSGNGLRIRRQGLRKFEGFWGHCWQSAVFPSGKAFGFNTFPPREDGEPSYNEGYVFDGSGVLRPARAVHIPWMDALNTRGDNVSCVLETADGEVRIEGETFINTRSRHRGQLPADFPIVQQAHARYRWDGEETVGMVERSSRPSLIKDFKG
ncbi:hypothetical protein [Mangrovimicrobium sediminis]|uniref:DUF7064 domain-containing protein n=1 Tax=Mangrovimicrobium sediminis TaxID=2562682 RepID=UPI0019824DAA|nr:hypothetical protein [Haliea sp. SAOS-164]